MDLNELRLRPHQREAVDRTLAYLHLQPDGRAVLIHHPTGSGKTGIMAAVGRLRARSQPVLVVCPSAALVGQLQAQFIFDFWARIKAPAEWHFTRTERLTISRVDTVVRAIAAAGAAAEPMAVFATIQALQQIHADPVEYGKLTKVFGTVFFDEGHREPAPQWGRAARGLDAPVVLFSATPYRNDLKIFEVNQDYTSFLSFQGAVQAALIRPVEIEERDMPLAPAAFVAAVIALRDDAIAAGRARPGDKLIVRADHASEVEDLFEAFRTQLIGDGRDDGVLAVHDTFSQEGSEGAWKWDEVPPRLGDRNERFLVHQHMLTEGIDDPACTMLALFSRFRNERQLVQQVGRLTRHPGPDGVVAPPALVFARNGDGVSDMWRRFLAYDHACVENGGRPPLRDRAFVDRILAALPNLDYVDGHFRRKADLEDPAIASDLRVPLAARIYETRDGFDLDAFGEAVTQGLDDEDRVEMLAMPAEDPSCRFHLSVGLHQTPLLAETLFQTASLEITVYAHRGDRLYFYDTRGLWVDEYDGLGPRLRPDELSSLLPESGTGVSALTLRNTDLGPLVLRGRTLQAASLAQAGVFLGEQTHVVTRATGRPGVGVRRTLGFTSALVRQSEGPTHTLDQFSAWCDEIGTALDNRPPAATLFGRFAVGVGPPADPVPLNILVELDQYQDVFLNARNEPVRFDLDSACVDITQRADGPAGYALAFEIVIDGQDVPVWIRWDTKKGRYWLSSRELSALHDRDNPKVTLLNRLNRRQPFRIIIDPRTVYAYGRFYAVDLRLGAQDGPGRLVLGLLTGVAALGAITSEKGDLAAAAATWPAGSLFGFIDEALSVAAPDRPLGPTFEALVCDDIGWEVADFIGVDEATNPRVVLIPAKWTTGASGAGASKLYDVTGQALKNLPYLKADGQPLPGSKRRFDSDWKLKDGRVPRRRIGPGSMAFRGMYQRVRSNPAARREVWLVLGGGILSRTALDDAFRAAVPPAHALQAFHLLLSVYAACQSLGIELRIFCDD
ncbi:DEAD/DEAH box helicase family protein [Methylobacterium sp. J-001]|uniref:DEAD/DEAH box helicase n=1 Tax=Methylobacterium sp. J-001 TaxID=2836609 RepID=UPI001FBBA74B|nr:DEAD/DEAH box helicase family protein [Methylobacterium sp. J-001]MCJ2117012.1 DEAD/DEAH box helicase family protein [Methylobacterium sp. J-001]